MNGYLDAVEKTDPETAAAIRREIARQQGKLELIASENFVSEAVLQATGSPLTNKYAEGYPGKRYYGGCEYVDEIETIARARACELFGARHANVQPHSGSQANMAVYFALLAPGDPILTLDLAHGGHLTHGSKVNFSGKLYAVRHYGVDRETERIDYDAVARLADEVKPKVIVAGASAYPRIIDFQRFGAIAASVGAALIVDMAHLAGLVVAGLHPNPVPHAAAVTSTTHKTLRGPRGGLIVTRDAELGVRFDKMVFPGLQGGPLMHVIAAKAVAFAEASRPEFQAYQQQVVANAQALAAALAAGGLRIVSGGTDNHLLLVDLGTAGATGLEAQLALDEAGITVNKNMIPFDTRPPAQASGIRLGTPALTTRGMTATEMATIAGWIGEAIRRRGETGALGAIRAEVEKLCARFPLYPAWGR